MHRGILPALLLATSVFAQSTATIYGNVSDKGGAVVPGVTVKVVHVETGTSRYTMTLRYQF